MWKGKNKCSKCLQTKEFHKEDIRYGDLRQEGMFVPDFQYYVKCGNCGRNMIITNIPMEFIDDIQTNQKDA